MLFDIPWQTLAIVLPLVFLSGFMDAIAGGGGLISLPAYLLAGVGPHQAVATNKLSSTIGLTVSTTRYLHHGFVNWKLALPTAVLSLTGASIGAKLNQLTPESIMRYILIVILPIVAALVLKRRSLDDTKRVALSPVRQMIIVCLGSFFIGIYDGYYGPGTGTFLLIMLVQFAHMDVRTASGNVKIMNLSSNAASLFVYLMSGQAIVPLGLMAGVFAFIGQYIGSGLVLKNGGRIVRPIVLCVLGLLMLRVVMELINPA